jgi:hypothetical protein
MRRSKRRMAPLHEAELWRCFFKTGSDLLCELRWAIFESDASIRAAEPDAWKRLGRIYLDNGLGDDLNGDHEWALAEFGEP